MPDYMLAAGFVLTIGGQMWLWFHLGRRWERKHPATGTEWWVAHPGLPPYGVDSNHE